MGFPGSMCRKGHDTSYSEEFDSYYCLICDTWWEEKCQDPECTICSKRPDKPSQMKKPVVEDVPNT